MRIFNIFFKLDIFRQYIDHYRWPAIIIGFGALTLFIMSWRWGGTIADSAAYFDTARYIRGEIPASSLRAPFAYRLLVPAVAAIVPGDLRNGFAALNWLAMTGAASVIVLTIVRLGFGLEKAVLGGLLLIVSVPTFWYAPYLLVDPSSILARAVFVLAVVSGQPWLAAAVGILATTIREENVLLLVWLIAVRQINLGPGLVSLSIAAIWLVIVRWWIIPALPSYVWQPSLQRVAEALADVRSLASLFAAAGIVVPLALIGLRHPFAKPFSLRSLLFLMTLPPLYAFLCVRIEGRVIWDLYPMLIPFAVAVGTNQKPVPFVRIEENLVPTPNSRAARLGP